MINFTIYAKDGSKLYFQHPQKSNNIHPNFVLQIASKKYSFGHRIQKSVYN
jgi:hypothetical protein